MMDSASRNRLPLSQCVLLASLMEVTAPKPGNVYRGANFEDLAYPDFLVAAIAIAPHIERAIERRLGETVLAAVRATHEAVGTNVNLGMILLVAPLAMVPRDRDLERGDQAVLTALNADDARDVYAAIRLARPGGLGHAQQWDVHGEPPTDLVAAMRLAADHDLVARQYAEGFAQVLGVVVPLLGGWLERGKSLTTAIVNTHVDLLSELPDSLIARKCGAEVAQEATGRAQRAVEARRSGAEAYREALTDLDFWLRSDGHRRNPGTTADLVAAGLFAALRDGIIKAPFRLA